MISRHIATKIPKQTLEFLRRGPTYYYDIRSEQYTEEIPIVRTGPGTMYSGMDAASAPVSGSPVTTVTARVKPRYAGLIKSIGLQGVYAVSRPREGIALVLGDMIKLLILRHLLEIISGVKIPD